MLPLPRVLPLLVPLLAADLARAELRLPAILGDHVVLQRERDVPLWGWDEPGQAVRVRASWDALVRGARADERGRWRVDLATPTAGGPYTVAISGTTERVLEDVLVGEVWLCAGQSNMEWSVQQSAGGGEALGAAWHPRLRLFDVAHRVAAAPLEDVVGSWSACTPDSARGFSAVGFWFGLDLLESLPLCADGQPLPIGLVGSNWGGTVAEAWTSREALAPFEELDEFFAELDARSANRAPEGTLAERQQSWWQRLEGLDPGLAGGWTRGAAEAGWSEAPVPGSFSDWGQDAFDGTAWYRYDFELPEAWAGRELVLELGAVDDMDLAFLDGELIGATREDGRWSSPRAYPIPARLARAGRRELALCVVDTGGLGVVGGSEDGHARIRPRDDSQALDLAGTWRARTGASLGELGGYPRGDWMHQNRPTALFNGMIAPLVPFALRGAIWYQGESNRGRAAQYQRLFPALIGDWRRLFGEELTFLWVQLAPYGYAGDRGELSLLREAQRMTLALPRTGMAVTMDIGDAHDIHPAEKREVGLRLARWARARTYGEEQLVFSGPLYRSLSVEGSLVRLAFDHAEGLCTRDGDPPSHFTIAGSDGVFQRAAARIEGETVLVSSPKVTAPVEVRYGWGATDGPNLANGAGLPAPSFRARAAD